MTIFYNFLLDRFGQNPYSASSPEIDTIANISNKNISYRKIRNCLVDDAIGMG
jgi:hypothetical protein